MLHITCHQRSTKQNNHEVPQRQNSRTLATPNAGEHAEPVELQSIAGGNAQWYSHFGRQAVVYKTKHILPL